SWHKIHRWSLCLMTTVGTTRFIAVVGSMAAELILRSSSQPLVKSWATLVLLTPRTLGQRLNVPQKHKRLGQPPHLPNVRRFYVQLVNFCTTTRPSGSRGLCKSPAPLLPRPIWNCM